MDASAVPQETRDGKLRPPMGLLQQNAEADAPSEIGGDASRIRRNAFLEEIYFDLYRRLIDAVPPSEYPRLLELGSGGGFLRDFAPHAITSDCVAGPGIAHVVDACRLTQHF